MAEPTEKAPKIADVLDALSGRRTAIRDNRCVACGGEAVSFRDGLSWREYCISGLCQTCQDQIFVEE